MEEIPEILKVAALGEVVMIDLFKSSGQSGVMPSDADIIIGRAILAERERCAKVADGLRKASTPGMPLFGAGMCNAADQIATAIRSGAHP